MKYVLMIFLAAAFTACDFGGGKKLKLQNDSLQMANMEKDRQLNNIITSMIEIDDNLKQIKEKENLISLNVNSAEVSGQAVEDRINQDIQMMYDLMVQNKTKITELEKQLKQSGSNNANLNKMIARLNQQMEEKALEIIRLNELLESKDFEITDLNFTISGLQTAVEELSTSRTETQQKLNETTEQLYKAYYAIGTKKELKEQNIITSEGFLDTKKKVLSEGFSADYFTVVDLRETDSIPLLQSKAKILTNHPETSYTLEKGEDETLTLRITDKNLFWSISKHLVVQIN